MDAADPFMSRIGLNNMTDKVLGSVVRAGGRAELASQWMQDYRAAPNPLQAGDEYRGMPEILHMESGLFRLQGPALKKPETHAHFHTNPTSGTHHHRQYFSKVSMQNFDRGLVARHYANLHPTHYVHTFSKDYDEHKFSKVRTIGTV